MRRLLVLSVALLLVGVASPVGASDHSVEVEYPYGFFYGTFDQSPNLVLTAGGRAEEFCPEGFGGTPAITTATKTVRVDGSVVIEALDLDVPIHIYEIDFPEAPPWITQVCEDIAAGGKAPRPFASGRAILVVRDEFLFDGGPPTNIYNAIRGRAIGDDGTRYRVSASANIPFDENGFPIGTPPDWVDFRLK